MDERIHQKNVLVRDEHELYHAWRDFNLSSAVRDDLDRRLREEGHDPETFRWAVEKALDDGYSLEELKELGSYQALLELVRESDSEHTATTTNHD